MAAVLSTFALVISCTRVTSRADTAGAPSPGGGLDVVPVSPAGGSSPAPWPSAGHDARHSGSTAALGPLDGRLRWERRLEGNVTPGPAVAADGTIYAASNAGVLHAIDSSTGADRWTYDGGGSYGSDLSTTPAVLDDGVVLWPGPGPALHALAPDGTLLWRRPFAGFVLSPTALADGGVAVADMEGGLSVLDWPEGDHRRSPVIRFSVDLAGTSYASPAAGPDGTVYATAGPDLVAVDGSGGQVRWRFRTGELIEVSPSVAPDGTVVVASNDPFTYGVGPDGMERWRHRRGALSYSSPSTTATGLVFAGDHKGGVAILDSATGIRRGRLQGQRPAPQSRSVGVWTSPVVDGAHRSYFGTRDGHVLGFAPDGVALFDLEVGATVDSYPALTADGALIVGVSDGRLLAIADEAPCSTARRASVPTGAGLVYSSRRPDAAIAVTAASIAGEVGIGIDDGPDERWTPAMLAVLARHNANATFFDIGEAAAAHPALVAEEAAAGNEVGLHTSSHRALVGRSTEDVAADLEANRQAVRAAGVEPQPLLRPPRGRQDVAGAEAACLAGIMTIGWSANVERALDRPAELAATIRGGDIVLAHAGRRDRASSVAALDGLLGALDRRGLKAVGIGRLLADAGVIAGAGSGAEAEVAG